MKRIVTASFAMIVGWITLLTYLLSGLIPELVSVRIVLVEWAIVIAAFAMLLGLVNVFSVHATRIVRRRPDAFFSLVMLVSMVAVLTVSFGSGLSQAGLSLFDPAAADAAAHDGIAGDLIVRVFEYVLIPIQSSLAALLPFLLAFAAYRTFKLRTPSATAGALAFLLAAIVALIGQAPLFNLPYVREAREWIMRVPATAGLRGILLGVALGVTATALRVLIGADRPTSD
jgi:hypothetical protein